MFTAGQIVEIVRGELITGNINQKIEDFSTDTRTINKGEMYIAIKGENFDGNEYLEDALNHGAIGAMINKDIDSEIKAKYKGKIIIKVHDSLEALQELAKIKRKQYDIPVIAITGSAGKTSTKDLIAKILESKYKVLKTEGNLNNHIGVPLTLLKLKDHTAMVIEMGMNKFGEIRTLTNIAKPTVAVITNIGTSHIGNLGSRENILKAKLEILEGLPEEGIILINNDNDLLHNWYEQNKQRNIKTFGIENDSNFLGYDIKISPGSSIFNIDKNIVIIPVGGMHLVYNAICAYGIGKILGVDTEDIIQSIKRVQLPKMRMQIEKINDNVTIINDAYNANFEAVKSAIEYLKIAKGKRKIAVLANMLELGDYSKELHRKVGEEIVEANIDILITIGKEAQHIAERAMELNMNNRNIFVLDNNLQAANIVNNILQKDDVLLLKGSRGMQLEEVLGEIKRRRGLT